MRTIHLLDIEYLGCGPEVSGADLGLVLGRYAMAIDVADGDLLVGAASTWVWRRVAFDLPSRIRFLPAGSGPDAADLRLLEEAEVLDLTRFDRLALGSGDHIFTDLVLDVTGAGMGATVVSYRFNTAQSLVEAADDVVDLASPLTLAA